MVHALLGRSFLQCTKFSKSSKIFIRRFFSRFRMDSEVDSIYDSHEKLTNLIASTGMKVEDGVRKYLDGLKYPAVPDFQSNLEWFNVSEPLSFAKHLKGKVVILDFFTYCCINCMHILPDLKAIENEFSIEDGLVVIGVHSAKFKNEKESSNILAAVQRYNIAHPVVNDVTSDMWSKCEIQCWPTVLILGPNFNPIVMLMGEGHKDNMRLYVKHSLDYYKSKKLISTHSLPIKSAFHLLPELKGPLLFPGKINTYLDGNREFLGISDTGNNRILVVVNGEIVAQIGGGKMGFKDGNFETAEFNQPQGLVFLNQSVIFVADTENHAIRKIDLVEKTVTTVAGHGKQCDDKRGGKIGRQQGMSSPWDLCIYKTYDFGKDEGQMKDVLIVAMAGTHQIWAVFLNDIVWWKNVKHSANTVICIAGSGREENRNNQYPTNAAFAQPSGLALCVKTKEVFIADSESSTVRKLSLVDGKVSAVVGGDRNPHNLFAFGDKDGALYDAKLQHSLGLALSSDENTLFVADTYNHKIKAVDITSNNIKTLTVSGDVVDAKQRIFNEPAGLTISADKTQIYIADTNNHSIKVVRFEGDVIKDISPLELTVKETMSKSKSSDSKVLQAKTINLNENGGKIIMKVKMLFERGLKLTDDAPHKWAVDLPSPLWSCVPTSGNDINNIDFVVNYVGAKTKQETFDVAFNLVTCTADSCFPKSFVISQPVSYNKSASISTELNVHVKLSPDDIKL